MDEGAQRSYSVVQYKYYMMDGCECQTKIQKVETELLENLRF